ncbi:hypothetical protein SAMN05421783_11794 [Thiocapsa roseopersicina]|uniref:Uncharacterized protein n=1 Tax=Thiocapsa roseopersicina TaxID=1058 RepID=A0A1H2ZXG6_THIRO|nr:hypothetical protein THIOKS1160018 [Thiocapsa sp. KS1]SDX22056.1 hypothetical protein SAMN05421783_11794 [Thiocapsa roseopersicina]
MNASTDETWIHDLTLDDLEDLKRRIGLLFGGMNALYGSLGLPEEMHERVYRRGSDRGHAFRHDRRSEHVGRRASCTRRALHGRRLPKRPPCDSVNHLPDKIRNRTCPMERIKPHRRCGDNSAR